MHGQKNINKIVSWCSCVRRKDVPWPRLKPKVSKLCSHRRLDIKSNRWCVCLPFCVFMWAWCFEGEAVSIFRWRNMRKFMLCWLCDSRNCPADPSLHLWFNGLELSLYFLICCYQYDAILRLCTSLYVDTNMTQYWDFVLPFMLIPIWRNTETLYFLICWYQYDAILRLCTSLYVDTNMTQYWNFVSVNLFFNHENPIVK